MSYIIDTKNHRNRKLFYLLDISVISDGRTALIETVNIHLFGTYGCIPEKSINLMTIVCNDHIVQ